MKIIALDSSGLVASVAVLSDGVLSAEYTVNHKKNHSQTLLPMLSEIKDMLGLSLSEADAIAIAGGPGSFTGLRIGSATAKGLGLALDIPVISVPTVDALAYNLFRVDGIICPIMDARRNQTYTGIYSFGEDGSFNVLRKACAVDISEIITDLNSRGSSVVFLGDGVPVFADRIQSELSVPYTFAPAHLSRQRAGAVAALAQIYYDRGEYESAAAHRPEYLRLSQAERERAEKEKQAAEGSNGGE